jgi:hypothetical protein
MINLVHGKEFIDTSWKDTHASRGRTVETEAL